MDETETPVVAPPAAFLRELLARTPLPDVVGRTVHLRPAANGRVWKGACPVHPSCGASFYAHPDGYHCFGCGAHGDAIEFVMRASPATFDEAVARLADAAGLIVPG